MKYETPEMTVLTSAITAIQSSSGDFPKNDTYHVDSAAPKEETISAYTDWE
jgi:hypothetical protein